jgi:uncharacterized membrane protein YfcA
MTPLLRALILLGAGGLAGLVGTAGGITTLVAYPALLATGVPALAANLANIVACTACWPGSALASGRELEHRGGWLLRHLPVAALGGGVGAALLLSTSAGAFQRIVPFLVVAGSCSLLLAPRLTRVGEHGMHASSWLIDLAILPVAVYGGYFGAGSGVMMLAAMLIGVVTELPAANALKNMLVGANVAVAALLLIVFRHIDWQATLPLAAGMLLGSMLGPAVARKLPPNVVRPVVAAVGFGLAIQLWLSHGS